MDYNINGILLTDPTITIRGMNNKFDEGKTLMDVFLDDGNNDAPITLEALHSDVPLPATTKLPAMEAWVNKKLEEFEI